MAPGRNVGRVLGARLRCYERGRRFWRHVRVAARDECWLWEGKVDAEGREWFGKEPAEARAYELAIGPPPPARTVRHCCGEPRWLTPGPPLFLPRSLGR